MATEITAIEIGVPGPAGVGITAAEKAALAPKASPTFTGTVTVTGDETISGNLTAGDANTDIHIMHGIVRLKSTKPTIAVGVALGTGGSVGATVDYGSDQSGRITLTAGTTSLAAGVAATITLSTARPSTDYSIQLTPANSGARTNGVAVGPVVSSTTQWTINFNVAPGSGSGLQYYYQIFGSLN